MDVFSTNVLTGVVNSLKPAPQFLLDRYFGMVQTEESEEIHFDVVTRGRRVAPFVSPLVEGQIVESRGFRTETFKPAYLKPKTPFNPRRALKRAPGESLTGSYSGQQRIDILVRQDLSDHRNMIDRRLEVMASQALVDAKVTVTGEKYPTVVVDFGRDASLSVSLDWTGGANKLDALQDLAQMILKAEGVGVMDVTMSVDVWKVFRADAVVEKRLDTRRVVDNAMSMEAQIQEGGVYMGTIDGFNIFVYSGWYIDPADDTEKPIFPDGTLVLTGAALEGVRAFGAVAEATDANDVTLRAVPYAPTSWVDRDPPMRYIMTQSAPLVVPYRVNASAKADVTLS